MTKHNIIPEIISTDPKTPEQLLWIAVIAQAVRDAFSHTAEKQLAIAWLTTGSEDFACVCEMAGIDPKKALRIFRKQTWIYDPLSFLPLPRGSK